jgi:hypothetical protein
MGFLKGVMDFSDSLRDAGATGEISLHLGRGDGLRLLELVAGASDCEAEAWSQRGRPPRNGFNSLKIGSLVFTWPKEAGMFPDAEGLFSSAPLGLGAAANENGPLPGKDRRFYGFEEDAPALH